MSLTRYLRCLNQSHDPKTGTETGESVLPFPRGRVEREMYTDAYDPVVPGVTETRPAGPDLVSFPDVYPSLRDRQVRPDPLCGRTCKKRPPVSTLRLV